MKPSWDETFFSVAIKFSERSSCSRIKVGCVLVRDNRIISEGYNGSTPNSEHCDDYWKKQYEYVNKNEFPSFEDYITSDYFMTLHHEWSEENEIHAEQNLIAFAAKNGIETEDSILYVTYSPCVHCAKLISQAGIKEVKYINEYKRDTRGIDFLIKNNIKCTKLKGAQEWQEKKQ